MSIDQRELRNTLGTFATGITVITTKSVEGANIGVTINSFASVSLEPPLVLFSLKTESPLTDIFLNALTFNVNILSAEQEAISNLFAGPVADKFDKVEWKEGQNSSPVLMGTLGTLECTAVQTHDGGDHTIFVGEVTHHENDTAKKALLYVNGSYVKL